MVNIQNVILHLLRPAVDREIKAIVEDLQKEIRDQGHAASGSLADTIRYEITQDESDGFLAIVYANEYWQFVDQGVSADRIPYDPTVRTGKSTSKYIQALIDWAALVRPELDEKERKSFAFAVAATHADEGNPTRGSYRFSNNGERLDFVGRVIERAGNIAGRIIPRDVADIIAYEIFKAA